MIIPRLLSLSMLGFALLASGSAATPDPHVESDTSGHGAVLCAWLIDISLKVIGDQCFPDQDKALRTALGDSIERINRFIVANEPATPDQVHRWQAQYEQRERADACNKNGLDFYSHFRAATPAAVRKSTDDLLSIPREPVADPCL